MKESWKQPTMILAGLAFAALPAYAANQTTVNIGMNVALDVPEAEISGLQDFSVKFDNIDTDLLEEAQTFCVFSPTRFFSMEVRGTAKGPNGEAGFWLEDSLQTDPDLQHLKYGVRLHDIFSGGEVPLGSHSAGVFENGIAQSGIDSNPFNSDKTCTDGENLKLTLDMAFPTVQLGGGHSNRDVVLQLLDGQTHTYTDVLTIVVAPDL